ncbi:MAG: hypothetical protein JSU04_02480 [Bdellovibrionales bacterium]|nr:hypothetical protein [Bdellovibrionales bacterium]
MIRNALIALYILAVLAISAVSRAESQIVFEPKRPAGPVIQPITVDPLPGFGANGPCKTKLSFGTREVSK